MGAARRRKQGAQDSLGAEGIRRGYAAGECDGYVQRKVV